MSAMARLPGDALAVTTHTIMITDFMLAKRKHILTRTSERESTGELYNLRVGKALQVHYPFTSTVTQLKKIMYPITAERETSFC